ncbi:MAG TPA: hypothetical protein PKA64_08885, partial [Myxococcota bacterium]|nr:hypothetical protein [Myxococcota bacterium]
MGLRHKLRQLLTSPAAAVLEGAIRDLIEEVIDSRGLVRRAEIEAIEHRVDALRRELGERRADLVGLTQSLDALARQLDDDLPLVHDDDTAARVDAL